MGTHKQKESARQRSNVLTDAQSYVQKAAREFVSKGEELTHARRI